MCVWGGVFTTELKDLHAAEPQMKRSTGKLRAFCAASECIHYEARTSTTRAALSIIQEETFAECNATVEMENVYIPHWMSRKNRMARRRRNYMERTMKPPSVTVSEQGVCPTRAASSGTGEADNEVPREYDATTSCSNMGGGTSKIGHAYNGSAPFRVP